MAIVHLASLSRLAGQWLTVIIDAAIKGSAILAIAWLAAWQMRKASAAIRHMIWLTALLSLLVLPVLGQALPAWRVLPSFWDVQTTIRTQPKLHAGNQPAPVLQPSEAHALSNGMLNSKTMAGLSRPRVRQDASKPASSGSEQAASSNPRQAVTAWQWAGLAWLAGMTVLLGRIALGHLSLLWVNRRLNPCVDEHWQAALRQASSDLGIRRHVQLVHGRCNAMPMTWGVVQPHLLVPANADDWLPQRRCVVLLHELAHVRRWDCLWQLLAEIICAANWFNPLVWLAARRMQYEAEAACDNLVLSRGSQPGDYAEHLLRIASSQQRGHLAAAITAIPMARPSKLEGRLRAILDAQRSRRALTWTAVTVAIAVVAAVAIPLAALKAAGPAPKAKQATHPPGKKVSVEETVHHLRLVALRKDGPGMEVTKAWQADGKLIRQGDTIERARTYAMSQGEGKPGDEALLMLFGCGQRRPSLRKVELLDPNGLPVTTLKPFITGSDLSHSQQQLEFYMYVQFGPPLSLKWLPPSVDVEAGVQRCTVADGAPIHRRQLTHQYGIQIRYDPASQSDGRRKSIRHAAAESGRIPAHANSDPRLAQEWPRHSRRHIARYRHGRYFLHDGRVPGPP